MKVNHLADCSVRLSCRRDPYLQTLARDAALHATGQPPYPRQPFRYLDLPPEIRQNILQRTDLVTPFREVEWNPVQRYSLRYYYLRDKFFNQPGSENRLDWANYVKCWFRHGDTVGCFCRRYHSSFSSICKCWQPPAPLFMVCRSMLHEAEAVCFSENRIIITPVGGYDNILTSCPDRFEASKFLSCTRPSALLHIRFLETVFPQFGEDYCLEDSALHSDWKATVNSLNNILQLPRLTLSIHMVRKTDSRGTLTPQPNPNTKWQTYRRILDPFRIYTESGVKRHYIHCLPPSPCPEMWLRYAQQTRMIRLFLFKDSSALSLLRDILGGENVERLDEGRQEAGKSNWLLEQEHLSGVSWN